MKVRGEWKSWLKAQHSENEDPGFWSHHFMANRWGNNGNSDRLYFGGLQNHCRLHPWNQKNFAPWKKSYDQTRQQIIKQRHYFFFFFTLFYCTILYWFCHTSTWIHHGCTRVPHPEPPSHLPPHTIPLGYPSAPTPSILYPASNLDWRFISYMILYMFQCQL